MKLDRSKNEGGSSEIRHAESLLKVTTPSNNVVKKTVVTDEKGSNVLKSSAGKSNNPFGTGWLSCL